MLYFCTFLSLLQLPFLCTSILHLSPVQAIQASQDREESLTHIWRINSWWALGFSAGSTRSPARLLSPGWRHRCLCIKHCLFRKTTVWREAWPWQGISRSAWLTRSHVPSAWKPWKGFCVCSAEYWDWVWELSFAAVWSPFTTVYIKVGNIRDSSLGKTVFRTCRGILSLHLSSLEHKAQESSEKEMHPQSVNTTIPDNAMHL